jgi:membrane-associated phospholipid phosphatase
MEFDELTSKSLSRPLSISWLDSLAHGLSNLFSPPLLGVLGLLLYVGFLQTASAWAWAGFEVLGIFGIPLGYIVYLLQRGEVSDFHIRIRAQRKKPLLVILLCVSLTWFVLVIGRAPRELIVLTGLGIPFMLTVTVTTLFWKISGHAATVAALSTLVIALFGFEAWPVLFSIPLMAWARVQINRHTLAQTIAGSILGSAYILAVIIFVG